MTLKIHVSYKIHALKSDESYSTAGGAGRPVSKLLYIGQLVKGPLLSAGTRGTPCEDATPIVV